MFGNQNDFEDRDLHTIPDDPPDFRHPTVIDVSIRRSKVIATTRKSLTPTRWLVVLQLSLALATFCSIVSAGNIQSLDDIHSTVLDFLQSQIDSKNHASVQYVVGNLDSRLKLHRCERPLQAFLPPSSDLNGKSTVGVRCIGNKPWSVYVPVEITVFQTVLGAARPLIRGHSLEKADLSEIKIKTNQQALGYYQNPDELIGMELRRTMQTGEVFSPRLLQAPKLVKRGEFVTVLAETASLNVRMQGKALADGAKGDLIRVINLKSKRIVEGIVTRTGVVRVQM
jgi:flagella basal body P-ring formation protein FlgA